MSKKKQAKHPRKPPKQYNYGLLETLFTEMATPGELAHHLDQLLYFLCYYQEKEGVQGAWDMYQDIYMLKEILQQMEKEIKNS